MKPSTDIITNVIRNRIQAEAKHKKDDDAARNTARKVILKKLTQLDEDTGNINSKELLEITQSLGNLTDQSSKALEGLARLMFTKAKPEETVAQATPEQILAEIQRGK